MSEERYFLDVCSLYFWTLQDTIHKQAQLLGLIWQIATPIVRKEVETIGPMIEWPPGAGYVNGEKVNQRVIDPMGDDSGGIQIDFLQNRTRFNLWEQRILS